MYTPIPYSNSDLIEYDKANDKEWQPEVVTQPEFVIINLLCKKGALQIEELRENLSDEEIQLCLSSLYKKGLVCCNDGTIRLLTRQCKCIIDHELGFVVGDDYDGRLTNWFLKRNRRKPR